MELERGVDIDLEATLRAYRIETFTTTGEWCLRSESDGGEHAGDRVALVGVVELIAKRGQLVESGGSPAGPGEAKRP